MKDRPLSRLEELLDKTLAEYVSAEPRPGLERRVLEYARSPIGSRGTFWNHPLSSWLSAVTILLVAASTLWLGHRAQPPTPALHDQKPSRVQRALLKPDSPSLAERVPVALHQRRKNRLNRVLPKRDLFPSPSPLSSEERALLAYAEHPPKKLPPELTELGGPIKPIQIAAIEIQPLDRITAGKEN